MTDITIETLDPPAPYQRVATVDDEQRLLDTDPTGVYEEVLGVTLPPPTVARSPPTSSPTWPAR